MEMGLLPDFPLESPFAPRWDKQGASYCETECGRLGEDVEGVWAAVHPMTLLTQFPNLWGVYADFRLGHQEISSEDRRTMSAFELEALATILSAYNRKMRKGRDGE